MAQIPPAELQSNKQTNVTLAIYEVRHLESVQTDPTHTELSWLLQDNGLALRSELEHWKMA